MKPTDEEYLRHLDHSIKEMGRNGFQEEVTQGFKKAGYLCYHTFDSRNSPAGFPDTQVPDWGVTTLHHVLLVIELKVAERKPSPEQLAWLQALRASGAITFCLWPRHRPVLADLYAGKFSERVARRLHVYTKKGE